MQETTLQIGGVEVPNLLIDSGAGCNVVDNEAWRWLKNKNIKADTPTVSWQKLCVHMTAQSHCRR